MNRIFHARIAMGQYLFLILIGILAVYMLWYKSPFLAAIFMLWLVVIIEKLIHTTYTVTPDGKLVEGKCAVLLPVKEEEFIRLLEERRG